MNAMIENDTASVIAVVGMAGRFPGADSVAAFWQNLSGGVESIRCFSRDELLAAGEDPSLLDDPRYVPACGYLEGIEEFDAAFFGMTPREAMITDPQHRVFLECAWHALEDAGYDSARFDGKIGLFAGAGPSTYLINNLLARPDVIQDIDRFNLLMGNNKDYVPTRASYKLNLKGPSVNVNTACSSSLTAIHLACQSLLDYQCDLSLAGGVGIQTPQRGYLYEPNGILSPDGKCRAFDAEAGGTVSGNGAGLVVLKRYEDAIADGDDIRALVLGSALNNDGAQKVGYTAPSIEGQAEVIAEALAVADVDPESIGYLESHGTGTTLGDPIEVEALCKAFGDMEEKRSWCALGSVKTNIGHLDEAAGAAGFIKTVLALQNETIPASLHFDQPNPQIDFANSPFFVAQKTQSWKRGEQPRRAGVSSFGIGGTNAHVVLQEAPAVENAATNDEWCVVPLSARDSKALAEMKTRLGKHVASTNMLGIGDVAYTLQMGRRAFEQRCAIVVHTADELASACTGALPGQVVEGHAPDTRRAILFQFPGQGTTAPNMGIDLYRHHEAFRDTVDRCAEILKPLCGEDIRHVMFPDQFPQAQSFDCTETRWAQPCLFVLGVALVKQWKAWGVEADAALGHSIGELAAAYWAGVFSLEDALSAVEMRGRLMGSTSAGAMLAVALSEDVLAGRLPAKLCVAAVNGSEQCVVSGAEPDIASFEETLNNDGVRCTRLKTAHAFHSALMDSILEAFGAHLQTLTFNVPTKRFLSNVTGTWVDPAQCVLPEYWVSHIRQPIRYADCLACAVGNAQCLSIEMGPGRTLSSLTQRAMSSSDVACVASIPEATPTDDAPSGMLKAAAAAWVHGADLQWEAFHRDTKRRRVSLPGYPFQRKRHWVDPAPREEASTGLPTAADASVRKPFAEWFYAPSWKLAGSASVKEIYPANTNCVLFCDQSLYTSALKATLDSLGWNNTTVFCGGSFKQSSDGYEIDPDDPASFDQLFETLAKEGHSPDVVLCVWGLNDQKEADTRRYLHWPLALIQSLGRLLESKPRDIVFLSQGLADVSGGEYLAVGQALLHGWTQTVPHEYPGWSCRIMDVESLDDGVANISALTSALSHKTEAPLTALRGSKAWVPCVEKQVLKPQNDSLSFRENGVYVITGGTSGVGLQLAAWIASQARVQIALLSRNATGRSESGSVATSIAEIRATGASVALFDVDVANRRGLAEVVQSIESQLGPIAGVIHSAGVADGEMIQRRSVESLDTIIAPKVQGVLNLEAALRNSQPDFVVLCSALSTDIGSMGQVGYIAANAFLNAFAAKKSNRDGERYVAIHWDAWRDTGMAVTESDPPSGSDSSLSKSAGSFTPIPSGDGVTVFEATLNPAEEWVLDEHRIGGDAVAPGTAFLEWVRCAFQSMLMCESVEMEDVFFLAPLLFADDEPRVVRLLFEGESTQRFCVVSQCETDSDAWVIHAQGSIAVLSETPSGTHEASANLAPIDPPALEQFGAHWHCIDSVQMNETHCVAELSLSESFHAEIEMQLLHPALLDIATGIAVLVDRRSEVFPFSYSRLQMFAPLEATVRTIVQRREFGAGSETFDVSIVARDGRVLLAIEGYTLKAKTTDDTPEAGKQIQTAFENFRIAIETPGDPDSLHLDTIQRRAPHENEIEVCVEAAGLNFKEVLYVYGLFADAPEFELPLGLECSGTVTRCGSAVVEYSPGDRVVVFDANCFQRYVTVDATRVACLPERLSFDEGATLPAAYMTAYHALVEQGRLKAGERVLIHAAAGGVGMAAVRIAQWIGAEVFATAGSDEKRDFLRSLGINHVLNSRTLDFAEEIASLTEGAGVDVVLNSLSGEFIEASLSVLAHYGRFLEIGVRDIYSNTPMGLAPFERHLSYIAIGVGPDMPGFSTTWKALFERIAAGELPPLPTRGFDLHETRDAFAFMAEARHIGKVAIRFVDVADRDELYLAKASGSRTSADRGLSWEQVLAHLAIGAEKPREDDAFIEHGLSNEEGKQVFAAALASGLPVVIVSTVDFHARIAQSRNAIHQQGVPDEAYDSSEPVVHGGDAIDARMSEVWCATIGVPSATPDDNFYAVGGDSLLAAQMLAKARKAIGANLSLAAFLDDPTLRRLCLLAEQAANAPETSTEENDDMEEGEL